MYATLYIPQQLPQIITAEGLSLPDPASGFACVPERVPVLLGCAPELVDVLVSNPKCVAYSIFDYEGKINHAAMIALAQLTGVKFNENEDEFLHGTILIVQA